jgi:hypothetical protein
MKAGMTGPKRKQNWPEELHRTLVAFSEKPFEWGKTDCGQMMLDCIQTMTGIDAAPALRGSYDTAFGAARVVLEFGGGFDQSMAKIAEVNGFPEVQIPFAQRGDMILLRDPETSEPACGVVALDGINVATVTPRGFAMTSIKHAVRAWRVQ